MKKMGKRLMSVALALTMMVGIKDIRDFFS